MRIRPRRILKYVVAGITAWCLIGFARSPSPIILGRPLLFTLHMARLLGSIPCRQEAERYLTSLHTRERDVLESKGTPETFMYCSWRTFETTDGLKKRLTRMTVTTSDVDERLGTKCTNVVDCNEYTAWLDDQQNVIKFTDPPKTTSEDPAVKVLGCTLSGMKPTIVAPKLIFSDGRFWWETVYDQTPSDSMDPPCLLSGRSLTDGLEARSSVRARYLCNNECKRQKRTDVPEEVAQLRAALESHDFHQCRPSSTSRLQARFRTPLRLRRKFGEDPPYSGMCALYYLYATGDERVCKDNETHISCDAHFRVYRMEDR